MKSRLTVCALLVGTLSGCQKRKTTIFVDTAWNRDYAMNACAIYEKNYHVACLITPEQMAAQLRLRLASAVLQSEACNDVTISYAPLSEGNAKDYESGWSLSFNIGVNDGDIDYSNSEWQIIDNKTKKRFGEGSLKDAVEAATRICIVATGRGGSVSEN